MTFQENFVKIRFSFHPEMALFSPSRRIYEPEAAISASICGITCAAYHLYASAQFLDFLDLAKNC